MPNETAVWQRVLWVLLTLAILGGAAVIAWNTLYLVSSTEEDTAAGTEWVLLLSLFALIGGGGWALRCSIRSRRPSDAAIPIVIAFCAAAIWFASIPDDAGGFF